ncbi:hypothetical protein [Fowlpox virus]|nr:hypothetical protein [Fowlpox virus]
MIIQDMSYNNYIMEIVNGEWLDYLDNNKTYRLVILNGYYDYRTISTLFDYDQSYIMDLEFYDDSIEEEKYCFALYFLDNGQKRVVTMLNATKYECMDTANEVYCSKMNAIYLAARSCINY